MKRRTRVKAVTLTNSMRKMEWWKDSNVILTFDPPLTKQEAVITGRRLRDGSVVLTIRGPKAAVLGTLLPHLSKSAADLSALRDPRGR